MESDADWTSCGVAGGGAWGGSHRGTGRHPNRGLHRSRVEGNQLTAAERAAIAAPVSTPQPSQAPSAPYGHGKN